MATCTHLPPRTRRPLRQWRRASARSFVGSRPPFRTRRGPRARGGRVGGQLPDVTVYSTAGRFCPRACAIRSWGPLMDRVAREHSFHWAAADYGARRVDGSRMQAVQSDPGRGVRSPESGLGQGPTAERTTGTGRLSRPSFEQGPLGSPASRTGARVTALRPFSFSLSLSLRPMSSSVYTSADRPNGECLPGFSRPCRTHCSMVSTAQLDSLRKRQNHD